MRRHDLWLLAAVVLVNVALGVAAVAGVLLVGSRADDRMTTNARAGCVRNATRTAQEVEFQRRVRDADVNQTTRAARSEYERSLRAVYLTADGRVPRDLTGDYIREFCARSFPR